ncbi:DUF2339 domain-containing protein [Aureispira sp. CCB-E]|uniref:DUF2339 domain-containing protein n=1 Tax=Aureispira sp. CCB-E TaxID=3051121 RepID=UPI0028690BF6|nr:DUF2339 domain-containing protein [Aureispira sp. CCB-E]WMX16159.1 DUF2339 domain-containing protein [Aureispira sp. CCB-E]
MKIVCPTCSTINDTTNENCTSCTKELTLNLTSTFQLENGLTLSIVALLEKVQQLEKRLVYVEENYSASAKQVAEKKILDEKSNNIFEVPKVLPNDLDALKGLLKEVVSAQKIAQEKSDSARLADLNFVAKKIEKRIQRLEQSPESNLEPQTKTTPIVEPKPTQMPFLQSYPNTIDGVQKALNQIAIQKELANLNRDLKKLEALLAAEKDFEQRLKNLQLQETYGRKEQEEKKTPQVESPREEELVVNKNLIFEVEQELASIWSAKQRAQITQDSIRFKYLAEKEVHLKKELTMLKRGIITARLDIETVEETKEKEVATSSFSITSTAKTVQQQSPIAVKTVAPKKEGPTAMEQFFAPLISGIAFIEEKYDEYKTEGKLSLFFLTVAGIVTLLFGFGFLAQYSAVTYFGDYLTQIKVGFGLICSCAAIGIGGRLIKKDKKFVEFGQALMGLGLSLNYLFIYFLSADPPLISSTIGFLLIFLNTSVSIVLSLRYESKIIALLALSGGALAPSYLQSTGENTHIYFAYLWLLCAASAYSAKRLGWETLNFISFLLVTLILGSSTYFNYADAKGLSDIMYLLLFHAFAYMYAYISLFDGFAPKKEQSAIDLIILIGAQAAMMMSLYFVYGQQQEAYATLSIAYLLNMLPFVLITVVFYEKWTEQQKSILVGVSSAFVAAAIPAYFGVQYRGLLWALQGIVLLGGGLILKLTSVRRLAYFTLLGGLANMFFNLDWYSMPQREVGILFTSGYINLWSIGIVLIVVSVLLKKQEAVLENDEQKVPLVLNEVLSVWGLFVFYITSYFYFENYAYNLALIPMFALLIWNNYRKLYLAEVLGILQVLVLAFTALHSMDAVGSRHFSDQLLYGQLAMVEILFVLWFLQLFYEKVLTEAATYKHALAKRAREVFYLILPIALIDSIHHGLPSYILYGFWVATGLAFVLAEFTKSKLVLVEFLGLVAVSMFLSFGAFEIGPLLLGNVLLLGIGFYKKAWKEAAFEKLDYLGLYLVLPYFFAVSTGLIYYIAFNDTGDDAFSAMQLTALVLLTMVNLGHQLAPIKRTLSVAYRLAWGISFIASIVLFLYTSNGESFSSKFLIGFVLLGGVLAWSHRMIYKAEIPYNGDQQSAVWRMEAVVLHLLNVLSYTTFLCFITGNPASLALTIVLFVHGIALVFNGLQSNFAHLNKVYIPLFGIAMLKLFFVDMKDADTIMKIIVFIIVGIICLLAAYFLIQYNNKNKPVETINTKNFKKTEEDDSTDTDKIG